MESKIALSVDVEDWYHTPLYTGSPFARYKNTKEFYKSWRGKYDCITDPTLRILELLDRYKIKATFFIIGEIIDKYPVIINSLKQTGHEIACHGLYHHIAIHPKTKKPLISKSEWKDNLKKAKALLEETFNRQIIGYRAPGAYFATWMIDILEELGFKYDSSIAYNSFYNKTDVKLKDIPSCPYWLNRETLSDRHSNTNILELPWSNLRLFNFVLPVGGAFFFRLLGYNYFNYALQKGLEDGDTMFYFHPYDLIEEKIPLSNFRHRPFFWINKGKTTEKRLEKLIQRFQNRFTACEEIYKKKIAQDEQKI